MGISVLFAACDTVSAPPEAVGGEIEVGPGETLYINPKTGEMFTSIDSEMLPQQLSITLCGFKPGNVHQTVQPRTSIKEIKGDWTGSCPSSSDGFYLTPSPSVLKRNTIGSYRTVTPKKVVGQRKYVSSAGASWIRTEIFATVPCVNGSYKSKVSFNATNDNGVAVALNPAVSTAFSISTCN